MWLILKRVARVVALGLLVLGGLGCPDSDIVVSGLGQIVFEVEVNPAGAGRYETAQLSIIGINLRPADPITAAALGDQLLGLLTFPVTVDLNGGGVTTAATLPLSPGTYELVNIKLQLFRLNDTTVPLPPGTECIDKIADLSDRLGSSIQPLEQNGTPIDGFVPVPTIVVPQDGNGTMRLIIDGPAFVAAAEPHYDCRDTRTCTSFVPPLDPPCLDNFRPNNDPLIKQAFVDDLRQLVFSFQ